MEQGPDPTPALRASDADRQRVVALLHEACVDGRLTVDEFGERSAAAYAARTHAELSRLTSDLVPVPGAGADLAVGSGPAQAPHKADVAPSAPPVVAVFSGARRVGRWRPARRETALAVFGGVELDLRDAELPPGGMQLSAWAVFGGIDVTVPEGVRVELSGIALFGGRQVHGGEGPYGSQAYVLRVHAVAVFGGVNVKVRGPRRR
jgi:Domain of unknown function (DUF1707)/Cell wall-active antibiotics response 4TMS YvqF